MVVVVLSDRQYETNKLIVMIRFATNTRAVII